jgi:hypothetical protein
MYDAEIRAREQQDERRSPSVDIPLSWMTLDYLRAATEQEAPPTIEQPPEPAHDALLVGCLCPWGVGPDDETTDRGG